MGDIPWPKIEPPHPDAVDHFVTEPTLPRVYGAYTDDGLPFLIGEAGLEAYGPDILKPPHLVKLPPRPEPESLTEDELAALEALTEQATPGPWDWLDHDLHAVSVANDDPWGPAPGRTIIITDGGAYPPEKDDAAFIAASRTAVPALIAEVRRLRVAYNSADDSWAVSLNTVIRELRAEIARLRAIERAWEHLLEVEGTHNRTHRIPFLPGYVSLQLRRIASGKQ